MSDIHALETNLDLKQNLNVYANCKQLDILHLIFNIFDGGVQADLTNYNVRLKAMKADNVPLIQNTQYTINKNVVTITPNEQLTTTSGTTKIELQFINKKTGEKKATFNLNLKVIASVLEGERSISTATYTLIDELENKLDKAENFFENIDKAIETNTTLVTTTNDANTSNTNLKSAISIGNTLKTNLTDVNNMATTNITNLTTQNNNAVSNAGALTTKNGEANTNITNLTTENTNAANNISTLTTKNSDAVTNKSNLDASISNANTTKTALDSLNTNANETKTALNISNTTANAAKTDLTAENVRAEANITSMKSFGDISALSQNVTNLKTEIENARNGEVDLDTRLDKVSTKLAGNTQSISDLNAIKGNNTDSTRTTTAKDITGAINELNSIKANKDKTIQTNLNADMIDGYHLGNLAQTKRLTAVQINNASIPSGTYTNTGDGILNADGSVFRGYWWHIFASYHWDNNGYGGQIAIPLDGGALANASDSMYFRCSTGATFAPWKRVAHIQQSAITTLYNGWTFWEASWGTRTLNKIGNEVTIDLMVSNPTPNSAQIFLLPSGYCPTKNLIVPVVNGSNTVSQLWISNVGVVNLNGTNLPAANQWVHLHATFQIND